MRILCVTNMYPGPEDPDYGTFVAGMCNALEDRGHEVDLAAITTRRRGTLRSPAKYTGLLADTARRAKRTDVLYAHYLVPTGVIAALCGATADRPLVLTAHGGDVALLGRRAARALAGWALERAAGAIAVSHDLARELESGLGHPVPGIRVINMGVDVERFRPHDRDRARGRLGVAAGPLVLAVGGLTERKNPLTLLLALARLRAEVPTARLVFVGDGPLRSTVEHAVARMGLGQAVRLTGAVAHAEIAEWMAACDVLALVSRREPLGQVALEALASGRPVVATSVGGAREVVPDGRAGRIVDPGDHQRIAAALGELLRSPPPPEACREAALPHALSRQAEAVEEVLRAAVARGGPERPVPPSAGVESS